MTKETQKIYFENLLLENKEDIFNKVKDLHLAKLPFCDGECPKFRNRIDGSIYYIATTIDRNNDFATIYLKKESIIEGFEPIRSSRVIDLIRVKLWYKDNDWYNFFEINPLILIHDFIGRILNERRL